MKTTACVLAELVHPHQKGSSSKYCPVSVSVRALRMHVRIFVARKPAWRQFIQLCAAFLTIVSSHSDPGSTESPYVMVRHALWLPRKHTTRGSGMGPTGHVATQCNKVAGTACRHSTKTRNINAIA